MTQPRHPYTDMLATLRRASVALLTVSVAATATPQTLYPPLVPGGEYFEDVEALLATVGQQNSVYSIVFSPDGRTLASASLDRTVRLWNVDTGEIIRDFLGHEESVLSVAFSPNGKTLASASEDETIRLWNVETGEMVRNLFGHDDEILSVVFSPDGKTLASASLDRTVRLWNADIGGMIRRLEGHNGGVLSIAFNPDGETLASASEDRTVRLWNVDTGEIIRNFLGHGGGIFSVAFSPDGKTLASASEDLTVRLWNVETGEMIRTLKGHGDRVVSIAFSPDGKTLASTSLDRMVRLWNIETGEVIRVLKGHRSGALSVVFSPDGKILASASYDSTVRLWNVDTSEIIRILVEHGDGVLSVVFSPDGKTLASASYDSTVRLWNVETSEMIRTLESPLDGVRSIHFRPDGETLAGTYDWTVLLWNVKKVRNSVGHGGTVRSGSVVLSLDATTLASATYDSTVQLRNIEMMRTPVGRSGGLSVAFSPDGRTLALASYSSAVRLWGIDTKEIARPLEGHLSGIFSIAFSPDSKTLASASYDRTVRLWNVETGGMIRLVGEELDGVLSVTFSPDGKTLAAAFADSTVRLWSVDTGEMIRTLKGHSDRVLSIDFSPDGKTLASASYDRTIRLWNIDTGEMIRTFEGHSDRVLSIDFSPDGKTLASASYDRTVRLWNIDTDRTWRILLGGQRETWIACDLDGRCIRHDDDTLLRRRGEQGRFKPVPPPSQPSQLELTPVPPAIETIDGVSTELKLNIHNAGNQRAHWIRVLRTDDPNDDPLVVALPWPKAILEANETAELVVRVSTHSSHDHPEGQQSSFSLAVTSLNGEPLTVPEITVQGKVPALQWKKAQWVKSGGNLNLNVELLHSGQLELPKSKIEARLSGLATPLSVVEQGPIGPGESIQVPFSVPGFEPTADTRVTVTVRQDPPIHTWTFPDQPIRPDRAWLLLASVATLLLALTVVLVFNHPLVRRLSAEPSELLHRPPAELRKARTLLKLTGRFKTVLREAEVDGKVLDRAVDFFADADPDVRVARLAGRLGVKAEVTDDAELRALPLSADFPLNLQRCFVHLPPSERPVSEVPARLKARAETRDQVTLVVAADPDVQDALHRKNASDLTTLHVYPSPAELTQLLLSPVPVRVLARIVASQVPRTRLSPYQTRGGINREAGFFGRKGLLADILNRDPANYLVVGGRQLGKTSLLKEIERRLKDDPRVEARLLVLSGGDLTGALARSLGLPRNAGLDAVLERLAASERRTLFLVDEADALVRGRRPLGEDEDDVFARLRSLSEEGRCHFVLAGFWRLYEAAVLDYRSSLLNFGETLRVGALETEACVELATVPMASMGLGYEAGVVDELVRRTGRRANLIAITCDEVLKNLDPTVRTIPASAVEAAFRSFAVQDALEGWKGMGDEEESRLDRAIVYATVERESFTLSKLLESLEGHGADVDPELVERSLKRLELAWVVGTAGSSYFYRVPLFVERVRAQDPSSLLAREVAKLGSGSAT